jgi:hypothetical protein
MVATWTGLGIAVVLSVLIIWLMVTFVDKGFLFGGVFGPLVFLILGTIALPIGLTYDYAHHNPRTEECTVTEKDRGGENGSYRVYTEECGVLANQDSMWLGKYDSADVWAQIEPGQTYTFRIVGWRNEFFSNFPNIVEILN